ncbi:hypothetical protein BCY91_13545 [Pelobium manganitolerans]|uniref:Uncharacterized protein n=1 Tax=Pelobium manganitolerans TaxID=1842495 RepID=A0A419SB04_9SPHI|nr:hypothetical protein BCY91_13545 [Pelobium manganitolerans]
MPFQHSLSCPHAGQWHLLFFRKKVNKKLSPAQFAREGSAFTFSTCTANSKGEKELNISLCLRPD